MENPFAKLVKEGDDPSVEVNKVVEIITDTEDGVVYWWRKFSDGTEDHVNKKRLNVEADDARGLAEELNQIRSQYGLDLETIEE